MIIFMHMMADERTDGHIGTGDIFIALQSTVGSGRTILRDSKTFTDAIAKSPAGTTIIFSLSLFSSLLSPNHGSGVVMVDND
jgi:hypothetical protein